MKNQFVIFCLLLTLTTSCKKLRELTRFTVTDTAYVTIPSGGVINLPFRINTPEIQSTSSQEYASNDTRADLVRTAFLRSVVMRIHTPNTADFDFLSSLEVFIASEGMEEVKIAYINNIPQQGLQSLDLITESSVDLKAFLQAESYALRVQVVTRQLPSSDITLEIESKYLVEADVF